MYKKTTIESEPLKTRVWLDDEEIKGLRKIKIEQEVGSEIPSIELTCISRELNVSVERTDIKFSFENGWVDCEKCLPEEGESVLALVEEVKSHGLHQEVLFRQFVEENDMLREGYYWCSYRDINIEGLNRYRVVAWQELPPVGAYGKENTV